MGRETTRPGSRSGSWGIRSTSASDGGGQRGSRVRKGIEGGRGLVLWTEGEEIR